MSENNIQKIIELLSIKKWKIIEITELKNLLQNHFSTPLSDSKFYKIIHLLKNKDILWSIKKEFFYIKNPKKEINEYELEQQFYRKLLKKHCKKYCNNERYIGAITALEINFQGTIPDIPERITICNKKKQAKEIVIFEKEVLFKKYEVRGKNIFTTFTQNTKKIQSSWGLLPYANMELSIIESLYNLDKSNSTYIENLIIKTLKKHKKQYDLKNLESIIKLGKFNSAVNRFFKLIKPIFPDLSEEVKKLIKKYWFLL